MGDLTTRAHAALQRDDLAEAAIWFERALANDPSDATIRVWLGQCLCGIGRRFEGCALLRDAGAALLQIANGPEHVPMLLELANELQHWSDFPGSLPLAEAAIRLDPASAEGHRTIALSHGQLNRPAEAARSAGEALRLAPGDAGLGVLTASLVADAGQHAQAQSRLDTMLTEGLAPSEAFRAHKELARVFDRLGAFAEVFPHLRAAAALAREVPEIAELSLDAMPAIVRENRAAFDQRTLTRWSAENLPQERPPPVFLVGFMRSGTTLTQQVLAAHPDAFVSDEVDLVSATLRELHRIVPGRMSTAEKLRRLDRSGVVALRGFYWQRAHDRHGPIAAPVFIDKFTMNVVDAGFIGTIFPDARLIFVQRDPRDVCLSSHMQLMMPTLTTVQLLDWERTVRFYAQVMEWWLYIRPLLPMPVLDFRYEDAVSNFEPTFRRVLEFSGLAWDPRVAAFHERAQGRFIASPSRGQVARPLYASSVARWQHYAAEFAPLAGVLQPYVAAFGYEQQVDVEAKRR